MDLKLIYKGFVIGLGKIMPGVSGAIMAISMGVYERIIDVISNPFKKLKQNIFFIFNLGIGIILSIVLLSNVINLLLKNYYFLTIMFFVGLILGTVPSILKEIKKTKFKIYNLLFVILAALFCYLITLIKIPQANALNPKNIFIVGIIDALAMIIPGISGTAIMMLLGLYNVFINVFVKIDILNIIYFLTGMAFGAILISNVMKYLFKKYRNITYYVILGFLLSSLVLLLINTINSSSNLLIGLILIIIGYIISTLINKI